MVLSFSQISQHRLNPNPLTSSPEHSNDDKYPKGRVKGNQMGLRGCSHLSLQHPFCSRVGAGSCLGFPSLPISCLLPSLPPVSPAPSLVLKFSYLTKHKHPHPGIPKRIPRDISHPRHELAPCSLPPTLLWHEHPSLRQKEQPSQMWMILPQASRTAQ